MKKVMVLFMLVLGLFLSVPANAKPKHALAKVASVAVSPVTHPKRALKDVLGSVLFGTEAVVDVVHLGTAALDKGGSVELKANPFHYVNYVVGEADSGLEKAAAFFFGKQI